MVKVNRMGTSMLGNLRRGFLMVKGLTLSLMEVSG